MVCNFFVLASLEDKLNKFLSNNLNVFQENAFRESHKIVIIDSLEDLPDAADVSAEDIFYIDNTTIDVFEDHIHCYK